jgi:hypothetical protein
VKKYLSLTIARQVDHEVLVVVDTDLTDDQLRDAATYRPVEYDGDWDKFCYGEYGGHFTLEGVRVIPDARVDDLDRINADPFTAAVEEEGGAT